LLRGGRIVQNWLDSAVFDCECSGCHGVLSLDRQTIDMGIGACPMCGQDIDMRDLGEVLRQAEREFSHR